MCPLGTGVAFAVFCLLQRQHCLACQDCYTLGYDPTTGEGLLSLEQVEQVDLRSTECCQHGFYEAFLVT